MNCGFGLGSLCHYLAVTDSDKKEPISSTKKYLAEFFGTLALVSVVVGSGIMGQNLSTDLGVVLLINAVSTVLALGLLIFLLAPLSVAQFNPTVSLALLLRRSLSAKDYFIYLPAQIAGAITGAILANWMFDLEALQISSKARITLGTFIGEIVSTAGLVAVILILLVRSQGHLLPIAVPVWIGAAYFFTSSTSFANPAVTIGRMFSDSFAGIAPNSVLPFIFAQVLGAGIGVLISKGVTRV